MDSVTAERFLNSYHNASPPPSPDVPEDLASFMLAADRVLAEAAELARVLARAHQGAATQPMGQGWFIQASDRLEGEFTEQDQTYLVRLAALTSTALDALAQLHLPGYRRKVPPGLPGRHRTRPGLPRGGWSDEARGVGRDALHGGPPC